MDEIEISFYHCGAYCWGRQRETSLDFQVLEIFGIKGFCCCAWNHEVLVLFVICVGRMSYTEEGSNALLVADEVGGYFSIHTFVE